MEYGKYSKGIETRDRIVSVAKSMFKQNGYDKTKVSDICKAADVKLGTFTYYFHSKQDLVSEIYANLLVVCFQLATTRNLQHMGFFQTNLTADQFYYCAIFSDPSSARYYHEVLQRMSVFDYIGRHVNRMYSSYNREFHLHMTEEDFYDILLVDSGIRREFFTDMFKNYGYSIPMDVIEKYIRKMNLYLAKAMGIDIRLVQEFIDNAEQLVHKVGLEKVHLF